MNPIFYFNRSKCFKQLKHFDRQYEDSLRAIELDDTYIKAWIANGESLVELGKTSQSTDKIDKGIQRLRKALGMCFKQGKREFEREIEAQIRKARKIKWYKEDELSRVDRQNLMSVLH